MFRRWFGGGSQNHYLRGMDQFNRGDFTEALAEFDRVVAESHDDTHPYTTLARFYRAEALSRMGSAALAAGDDATALDHLERALEDQPGYPDLHFRRGVALLRRDRPVDAEQAARRALALNHQFVEARALLVLAYRASDQAVMAERELDGLTSWNQSHPLLQAPLTVDSLSRHVFQEEDRRARIQSAESEFLAGRWEASRDALLELVHENPNFADLRLRLASVCYKLRDFAAAAEHVDAALQRNPQFADALVLAGAVRAGQGRWGDGLAHLREGRARGAPSPFADYAYGLTLIALGRYGEARPVLASLRETADAAADLRVLLANVMAAVGRSEEALPAFAELLSHSPREAVVVDAVAAALAAGDVERARRFASRLPAKDPQPVTRLARAEVLAAEGKLEVALEVLRDALAEVPTHAALRFAAARVAAARKEWGLALTQLQALGDTSPQHPGAGELMSQVLEAREQPEEALAALDGAVSLAAVEQGLARLSLLRQLDRSQDAEGMLQQLVDWAPLDPRVRVQQVSRWEEGLVAEPTVPVVS